LSRGFSLWQSKPGGYSSVDQPLVVTAGPALALVGALALRHVGSCVERGF
jgi:hypothetical protein